MSRLQLFGGLALALDPAENPAVSVRPRILALLALLAGHGPTGLSRDKALAYLWPDSDTPHARNSLKQALHSLRRVLGAPAVSCTSGTIRLEAALIEIDLWHFEAALGRSDPGGAVALYRGPFLDGFHAGGLPEFERWVEDQRQRYARRYIEALEALTRDAEARGDCAGAVRWGRRLVEADPLSSAASVALMRALTAAGDPAAALEHAREHAAIIRRELDLPVEEPVAAMVRTLRAVAEAPGPQPSLPPPPRLPGTPDGLWNPMPAAGLPVGHSVGALARAAAPARRVLERSGPRIYSALLMAGTSAALAMGIGGAREGSAPPDQASSLVVLPFVSSGDRADTERVRALSHLVAAGLDGLDEIRTVPLAAGSDGSRLPATPEAAAGLAAQSGARLYVTGVLVQSRGRLRASATLRDRGNADQQVGRAQAEAEAGRLFDLADDLVAGLVTSRLGSPGSRLARTAAGSTRSLLALKAYLEGERLLRTAHSGPALDAFRRAVRADTAFALAYYRLSVAADLDRRSDLALWAAELASRFAERLPEHERRLVEAFLVHRRGHIEEAERRYRRIVADFPRDEEAWFQLAEVLFHLNPLRGRSVGEARPALQRLLTLEPRNREALLHLARIAATEGDVASADSLARLAWAAADDSGASLVRVLRGLASNDVGAVAEARELADDRGIAAVRQALDLAAYDWDLTGVEHLARLLAEKPGGCERRLLGAGLLAQGTLARGLYRTARARLALPTDCGTGSLELRALYETLPFFPMDPPALQALAAELDAAAREPRESTREGLVLRHARGMVALAQGDSSLARRHAEALAASPDTAGEAHLAWALAQSLAGRLALSAGRVERALSLLERARWERVPEPPAVEADDRYLRAGLLARLGRGGEAEGWYGSIAQRSFHELVYRGPALYWLGRLRERRGDRVAAFACYARVARLSVTAEKPLPPFVEAAARRASELGSSPIRAPGRQERC